MSRRASDGLYLDKDFGGPFCYLHYVGIDPRTDPSSFFTSGCITCEEKKARGVVNGTEGKLHKHQSDAIRRYMYTLPKDRIPKKEEKATHG